MKKKLLVFESIVSHIDLVANSLNIEYYALNEFWQCVNAKIVICLYECGAKVIESKLNVLVDNYYYLLI